MTDKINKAKQGDQTDTGTLLEKRQGTQMVINKLINKSKAKAKTMKLKIQRDRCSKHYQKTKELNRNPF